MENSLLCGISLYLEGLVYTNGDVRVNACNQTMLSKAFFD